MREIEFRGKHTHSNDFVFGYYVFNKERDEHKIDNGCGISWFVKPETVGQYTGLKDKNGTKIFKGDIVKCYEDGCIYEIKFDRIGYDGGVGLTGFVCVDKNYRFKEIDYDTHEEFYTCNRGIDLKQIEVIGNIYDTTELLEGAE